jgi:hypothetical protein
MATPLFGMMSPWVFIGPLLALAAVVLLVCVLIFVLVWRAARRNKRAAIRYVYSCTCGHRWAADRPEQKCRNCNNTVIGRPAQEVGTR